jgi:hypothetical protein
VDNFLTLTGVQHLNNPTGAAVPTLVSSTVVTTPIDPASKGTAQAYPIEKLFLLKECYTKYALFRTGDFLVSAGVTYAVVDASEWAAQGGLDTYYALVLEKGLYAEENFGQLDFSDEDLPVWIAVI